MNRLIAPLQRRDLDLTWTDRNEANFHAIPPSLFRVSQRLRVILDHVNTRPVERLF
jgi:hypothetical protein